MPDTRSTISRLLFACSSCIAILAFCSSVHGWEYDAEADIGLVAESPSAAAANTARLSAALNAQWSGGRFKFANGQNGPILNPIRASAKEFFFAGTIETSARIGGALLGFGTRNFPFPSEQFSAGGALGGAVTRFTRIDGEKGGAIIRLRGSAFLLEGIEFRGRPYIHDPTGEGPKTGSKTPVGIEVEGRVMPPTGHHMIRNCSIIECTYGICARAGYYEQGSFVKAETHADNCNVEGVLFHAVDSCFRAENLQALVWSFRDIFVGNRVSPNSSPTVVCDVVRGGNVVIDGLSLNLPQVVLFKVRDYIPAGHRLVCTNFRWDAYSGPTDYLTLFYYDGPIFKDMSSLKWSVRFSGDMAHSENPPYDTSKVLHVPAGFPMEDIKFDVARLPAVGP
jgi:hypothetical protein